MTNEQKPAADDLVARLQAKADMIEQGEKIAWGSDSAIMREAAARIESLREALEPFAECGRAVMLTGGKAPKISGERLEEHLERARRAFGGDHD